MLSTTAKAQARAKTKEQEKAAADGGDAMDTVGDLIARDHASEVYSFTSPG